MTNILSIIVARKGSTGLKSKCMLPINSKPVVEHVVEWSSGLSDKEKNIFVDTVVSTDIEELEEICQKYNAFYLKRDDRLSGNAVRIEDVMADAVEKLKGKWDYLSLLYGNIPVRYESLFYEPLDFLEKNKSYDAALSFQNVEKYNPAWMIDLSENELPDWNEKGFRRQDLKQYMVHDGHTCITRSDFFIKKYYEMKKKRTGKMYEVFGTKIKPWLNGELVIDIDTERDYWLANAVKSYEKKK
jgi:CMP-N-acetylneuraminic acid synthetase